MFVHNLPLQNPCPHPANTQTHGPSDALQLTKALSFKQRSKTGDFTNEVTSLQTQTNQVSVAYDPWNTHTQSSRVIVCMGYCCVYPICFCLFPLSIHPLLLSRSIKVAQIYFSSLSLAVTGQMGYVITLCSGSGCLLSWTRGWRRGMCCGLERRLNSKLLNCKAIHCFPAEYHGCRPGGADAHPSCFTLRCKLPQYKFEASRTTSSTKSKDEVMRPLYWTLSVLEILRSPRSGPR